MAPTPQQRDAFSRRLVELRSASGLTQKQVSLLLVDHGGNGVTVSAYSEYERGVSAPSAQNARALEEIFDEPAGALGELLGYRGDDPSTAARLERLEDLVEQQQEALSVILETLERLDRGAP